MLFKWRNSNEFHVLLCDAEGLLAACFGVNIMEGLIDCDATFLTEILEGVQVQRLPDVIFMRIVLLSNKVHEDKPDIIIFALYYRTVFVIPVRILLETCHDFCLNNLISGIDIVLCAIP